MLSVVTRVVVCMSVWLYMFIYVMVVDAFFTCPVLCRIANLGHIVLVRMFTPVSVVFNMSVISWTYSLLGIPFCLCPEMFSCCSFYEILKILFYCLICDCMCLMCLCLLLCMSERWEQNGPCQQTQ